MYHDYSFSEVLEPTGLAVLDTMPLDYEFHRTRELTRISVPRAHRRKGVGTRLMKRLLAVADVRGERIHLSINSYGDGGMTNNQLRWWYKRFGFHCIGHNSYIRFPVPTNTQHHVPR